MRRCTETGVWIPTLAETLKTLAPVLDGTETRPERGAMRLKAAGIIGKCFLPGDTKIEYVVRWRRLSDDTGRQQILPVLECGEIVLTGDAK